MLESIGPRPRPAWVRGPARIEGEEIVLDGSKAESYALSDTGDGATLLLDLTNLRRLGKLVKVEGLTAEKVYISRSTDTTPALEFAERHGFLRHGPTRVGAGEVREFLNEWFLAGQDLTVSAMIYSMIRRSQEEGSAELVRSYLRTLRDIGYFKGIPLPDADGVLLEFASVQVAESITSGMSDCTPTLSAACSLLDDGKKVGGAGDFRFGSEPGSLVGAAYYQLALLVSRKEPVRECEECKALFVPKDPRQIEHKTCGSRKRQRKLRRERTAGRPSPHGSSAAAVEDRTGPDKEGNPSSFRPDFPFT